MQATYSQSDVARPKDQRLTPAEVDIVMNGYVGKTAVREGWWWELHQHLVNNATNTFITNESMAFLRGTSQEYWDDAETRKRIEMAPIGMAKHLLIIYEEILKRKAIVWEKYVNGKESGYE